MFGGVFGSTVLCPSDANSTAKLVREMVDREGIVYLRTARPATEVIYSPGEKFEIGGSKVLRTSSKDRALIVACGVPVLEAIKAADELKKNGINICVIDAYSVKPVDASSIAKYAHGANNLVVTVEDHSVHGGLGDAVLEVFATDPKVKVYKLGVWRMPASATPQEQYEYQGIDAESIVKKIVEILG